MCEQSQLLLLAGPPLIEIGVKLFKEARNGVLSQTAMGPLVKGRYDVALQVCEARVTAFTYFLYQMSPMLDQRHVSLLSKIIQQMRSLHEDFNNALDKASASGKLLENLEKIIGQLRQWQQDFDRLTLAVIVARSRQVHMKLVVEALLVAIHSTWVAS
jgi:hypothetical protein